MKRLYFLLAFIMLFGFNHQKVQSQDIHYSHIAFSPIYTNPAFTGYFNGNLRLYANYRNQFLTVLGKSAFQTYSGSADVNIPVGIYSKDFVGAGIHVFHDRAGKTDDGGIFTTTNIGLSGSYSKALSKDGDHALSLGVTASFLQRKFVGDQLLFGSNFNPGDPNNPFPSINENQSYLNFDFSLGLVYLGTISKKVNLYTGFTLAHLLQPRWSFLDPNEGKLPVRWGGQLGFNIKASKKLELSPFVFYQHQGKIGEIMVGNLLDYRIIEFKGYETDLLFGTYLRALPGPEEFSLESFIILLGVDYTDLRIAFSYDAHFGGLRDVAKLNSAFEVSLKYTLSFLNSKQLSRNCPTF